MSVLNVFNKQNAGRKGVVWFAAVSFLLWSSTVSAAYFQGGSSSGKSFAEGGPETTPGGSTSATVPEKAEPGQSVSPQSAAKILTPEIPGNPQNSGN